MAANRDEFYARPSLPAAFWPSHPTVLAGKDLQAGGTWLGLTHHGRFAALTNYRDPTHNEPNRPSRGQLVADFLTGDTTPAQYLEATRPFGQRCNGYNLLVADLLDGTGQLFWASNVTSDTRELAPGIYGLSNHVLDTHWPKVGAGKTALDAALKPLPDESMLRRLLVDPTIHPDSQLPSTGIPLDWERALSAAFIQLPGYGTRASTVIKLQQSKGAASPGWAIVDEQTWLTGGQEGERRRYRVSLQPKG